MAFANFTKLPAELQLSVLENVSSSTLINLLEASRYSNKLSRSIIDSKIFKLTSNNDLLFIGVFSPQNKGRLVELYNTVCVSNQSTNIQTPILESCLSNASFENLSSGYKDEEIIDLDLVSNKLNDLNKNDELNKRNSNDDPLMFQTLHQPNENFKNSIFQLGNLELTRDPLRSTDFDFLPARRGDGETLLGNNSPSCIHLIVHEDSPYIQLKFEMQLKRLDGLKKLFEFRTKLLPLADENAVTTGVLEFENGSVKIDYKLTKGQEVPSMGDYDYDIFYNYNVEFGNIDVGNGYLLDCVEKSERLG